MLAKKVTYKPAHWIPLVRNVIDHAPPPAPRLPTCVHPGGIKTAIAQNARTDESMAALGIDPRTSKEKFSKNLITSAEQASATILKSVQNNKRRVLVGWDAIVLDKVQRLFPAAYAVIVGMILRRTYNR
jgi:short-subunit dehydrogenase